MDEKVAFPVYTRVSQQPATIYELLDRAVFDYPFFNQGVYERKVPPPDNQASLMEDLATESTTALLPVKGFIFHTSHCGSTLLSRMLGCLPGVRVVAETEAINGLLLSSIFYDVPEQEVLLHLQRIAEAYRQPMKNDESIIFKLTSWNVFFIRWFQQLYPHVRWIYLDRETDEVVQSLLKGGRGFADWWDQPTDSLWRNFTGKDFVLGSKENFLRHMVGQHRYHAHLNHNPNGCLLNYPSFIQQFEKVILPHFQLSFSQGYIQKAMQLTRYDSKQIERTPYKKNSS